MKVYHGSFTAVSEPLVLAGRRNLDFGRGFYTTRLKDQAEKWAIVSASKKSRLQKGVVSFYEFEESLLANYNCKVFPNYDLEWLDFVVACRQGRDTTNYDIIEGGIANDQVIDTVEDYENGRLTAEQALDQLKYKQPNNQICFRNQEIIDKFLRYLSFEEVPPIQ